MRYVGNIERHRWATATCPQCDGYYRGIFFRWGMFSQAQILLFQSAGVKRMMTLPQQEGEKMKRKHNILVAVDGSKQSFDAVAYIGSLMLPSGCTITLLHILPDVPEAFLDLGIPASLRSRVMDATAWNVEVKRQAEAMMVRAGQVLQKAGHLPEAINVQIRKRKIGIARDIVAEARKDYEAVVVGRTGVSKLKDIVMGSIANKLVHRIQNLPIAVVDGKPSVDSILIGFDGSEGAKRAVAAVCRLMPDPNRRVDLCHVIRSVSLHKDIQQVFDRYHSEDWLSRHHQKMQKAFLEAEKKLQQSGFLPGNVRHETVEDKISRAVAIKTVAKEGKCGTIVVGRRGLTAIEAFFMGRVSQKVLQLGKKHAVWIV